MWGVRGGSKGLQMAPNIFLFHFPAPDYFFSFLESIKCKHAVASSSGDSSLLLLSRDGSVVYVELGASAIPR